MCIHIAVITIMIQNIFIAPKVPHDPLQSMSLPMASLWKLLACFLSLSFCLFQNAFEMESYIVCGLFVLVFFDKLSIMLLRFIHVVRIGGIDRFENFSNLKKSFRNNKTASPQTHNCERFATFAFSLSYSIYTRTQFAKPPATSGFLLSIS